MEYEIRGLQKVKACLACDARLKRPYTRLITVSFTDKCTKYFSGMEIMMFVSKTSDEHPWNEWWNLCSVCGNVAYSLPFYLGNDIDQGSLVVCASYLGFLPEILARV
jgi:hypothetical protein